MACAVSAQQFFLSAGVAYALHIVFFILVQQFQFLTRGWVHAHQHRLVASQIGGGVDLAVIWRKLHETYHILKVCGQHGTERFLFRIAVKQLSVHTVYDGHSRAEFAVVVCHPTLIVSGIFRQHGQFAR